MFNDTYAILSLPEHKKHFILRTSMDKGNINLDIDDINIKATINAICDNYNDSLTVVKNLSEV